MRISDPSSAMHSPVSFYSYLDIGAREEQQDACISLGCDESGNSIHILSDGVGGHSGGRLASRAIIEVGKELWENQRELAGSDPADFLRKLAGRAHEKINEVADASHTRARATLVALLLVNGSAHWVHSGDSRLYHFRNGKQVSRTFDHSVVQILLERGKITEEEMGTHPDQGRLLQSIGGERFEEPEYGAVELEDGEDTFLLCSDGFWEHLSPKELRQLVNKSEKSLMTTLERRAQTAIARAGDQADNLSVILVKGAYGGRKRAGFVIPGLGGVVTLLFAGFWWAGAFRSGETDPTGVQDEGPPAFLPGDGRGPSTMERSEEVSSERRSAHEERAGTKIARPPLKQGVSAGGGSGAGAPAEEMKGAEVSAGEGDRIREQKDGGDGKTHGNENVEKPGERGDASKSQIRVEEETSR